MATFCRRFAFFFSLAALPGAGFPAEVARPIVASAWAENPVLLAQNIGVQLQALSPWLTTPAPASSADRIAAALIVSARTPDERTAAGVLAATLSRPAEGLPRLRAAIAGARAPDGTEVGRRALALLGPWVRILEANEAARRSFVAAAASVPEIDHWRAAFDGAASAAGSSAGPVSADGPTAPSKLAAARLRPAREDRRPWHRRLDFDAAERTLETGVVQEITPIRDYLAAHGRKKAGSFEAYVVTFADGTRALWKPEKTLRFSYAEKAAYDLSKYVGIRLVPPTVIREIDGRTGSLQLWIDSSLDPGTLRSADFYAKISAEQLDSIRLFQFVFGQWDSKPANMVLDDAGGAAMIDNSWISMRQQARYGVKEAPFLLVWPYRAGVPAAADDADPFPFDKAVLLKSADLDESAAFETLRAAVAGRVEDKVLRKTRSWVWRRTDKDGSVKGRDARLVFWRGAVWAQHGAILRASTYPESALAGLRAMTFEGLRRLLPRAASDENMFSDTHLREILARRDQVLRAAAEAAAEPR